MSIFLVTGCAGFIGSNLVDRLLKGGNRVIGIDNLRTGQLKFLSEAKNNSNFIFCHIDLIDYQMMRPFFEGVDAVFHLAANADIRFGVDRPKVDLEQNIIVTHNVLEAMRESQVKQIIFSSTGSVYGEASVIPTGEESPFPVQTSLYGASKVAGEGLISAYCEAYQFQAWIFRFVSILGERYTHGHIFDFYKKLKMNPNVLEVLGNGLQKKSYLYVQDCIDAILYAFQKAKERVNIFNLGVDDYCDVNTSISWICNELNVSPKLSYAGGERGWVGDNPFIYLDTMRINNLGWKPKLTIQEAVIATVNFLRKNEWVFESR